MQNIRMVSLSKPEKMTSYVDRIMDALSLHQMHLASQLMHEGMAYYTNRVSGAVMPYATADAGMLSAALRIYADQLEKENDGAEAVRKLFEDNCHHPENHHREVIERANCR